MPNSLSSLSAAPAALPCDRTSIKEITYVDYVDPRKPQPPPNVCRDSPGCIPRRATITHLRHRIHLIHKATPINGSSSGKDATLAATLRQNGVKSG